MTGKTISHLNLITVDPAEILKEWEEAQFDTRKLQDFYNLVMGWPYISAENRLSTQQVLSRCGMEPMRTRHHGPSAMGIDVQGERRGFYVVIGIKVTDKFAKILRVGNVGHINDIYDLAKKFNVKCAVIDEQPEQRLSHDFARNAPFQAFSCKYKESQRKDVDWNSKERLVSFNRTELCDETHDLIAEDGRVELPRKCFDMETYADQMNNTGKTLDKEKEAETGVKRYTYNKKFGDDDYYHATNYFLLALRRVGVSREEKKKVTVRDAYDDALRDSLSQHVGFMGM